MRGDGSKRPPPGDLPDGTLWRQSRVTESPEDEAARFLDLAGFADGRLDPDDEERVADWLADDPVAAADVAAARALADAAGQIEAAPEAVVARARALVPGGVGREDNIVPFRPRPQPTRPGLHGMARWGSLVAAVAVASWLGFTLGMDTSRSLVPYSRAADEGFLHELLNPSTGFMANLTEGAQT